MYTVHSVLSAHMGCRHKRTVFTLWNSTGKKRLRVEPSYDDSQGDIRSFPSKQKKMVEVAASSPSLWDRQDHKEPSCASGSLQTEKQTRSQIL